MLHLHLLQEASTKNNNTGLKPTSSEANSPLSTPPPGIKENHLRIPANFHTKTIFITRVQQWQPGGRSGYMAILLLGWTNRCNMEIVFPVMKRQYKWKYSLHLSYNCYEHNTGGLVDNLARPSILITIFLVKSPTKSHIFCNWHIQHILVTWNKKMMIWNWWFGWWLPPKIGD